MEKKSALEASLVEEFVGKSHGDLERVKELLAQEPALINAAWDWGGGDWETGLGVAAHMDRSNIANYLLEHGARLDLFTEHGSAGGIPRGDQCPRTSWHPFDCPCTGRR